MKKTNFTVKMNLNVNGHKDIGFINIDMDTDIPLYIDPTLVDNLKTEWCIVSSKIIKDFFDKVFKHCKEKNYNKLYDMLSYGHEPNETKLGLSNGQSIGKGSKAEKLFDMFKLIADNSLIEKGLISNPYDIYLFTKNFAEDRMSDLLTNILRKQLYDFTIKQCIKHNIELGDNIESIGYYWNIQTSTWEELLGKPLIVDNKRILLVPKTIVRKQFIVSTSQYIQKHILSQRQQYHLRHDTKLTHEKFNKRDGWHKTAPTKKEVYAEEVKGHNCKEYAADYAIRNIDSLDSYRRQYKNIVNINEFILSDAELDTFVYSHSC